MRFRLTILWLLLIPGIASQAQNFDIEEFYPIEASHSFISFSVTYMGYAEVRGNFADFKGTFRYDPDDITKTSVSLSVDVASIDTDLEWRDNDLKSENWFDAEKFPKITFVSKNVTSKGEGFTVIGDLTIRDVTKEIAIEVNPPSGVLSDIRGDTQVILSGTYTLDRTEYGVAGERWSRVKEGIVGVANEVTIEFSMLGKRIEKGNLSNFVRSEQRPPGRLYAAYKRGGTDEVFTEFEKLKSEIEVNSGALNIVGYMLIKEEKFKDAIKVMKKNVEEFPDEGNTYASLGAAYANAGDLKKAKTNYELAAAKDPADTNVGEILRNMK